MINRMLLFLNFVFAKLFKDAEALISSPELEQTLEQWLDCSGMCHTAGMLICWLYMVWSEWTYNDGGEHKI